MFFTFQKTLKQKVVFSFEMKRTKERIFFCEKDKATVFIYNLIFMFSCFQKKKSTGKRIKQAQQVSL